MTRRPNILFISTDQQAWDALSAHGTPGISTPHMDRLHENGMAFTRNYCTDPVCGPARTSWMTGRYTSETGVPTNGGRLHDDLPDLGQILAADGYRACHAGKWHVSGRDVRRSFDCLYFGKTPIAAGGAEYYDPPTTHAVLDFLTRQGPAEPFFLHVAFTNPHDICEYLHDKEEKRVPGPLEQGLVVEEELPPLPENYRYDERETVLMRVTRRGTEPLIHPAIQKAVLQWDELQWRYLMWHLYRFTEKVDCEIGLVLSALAASPFRENTVIVFSADHGESAGRHRTFQKFTLYEESIRTPFVIATLGDTLDIPKGVLDEHLVSGVDLLPTVCDYAGARVPEEVRGRSLRPIVEGRETAWREFAYVESSVWGRALVGRRWKYVCEYIPNREEERAPPGPDTHAVGLEQLFDLENDPLERVNLAVDPAHGNLLANFRSALGEFERGLDRRPFSTESGLVSSGTLRAHTERILAYWRAHPELKPAVS